MSPRTNAILFALFLLSGFCGLLYQVVWLRMAFAAFGVITPVLSIVLSVFMLGLSIGSWAGGKLIGPLTRSTRLSAIWYYGLIEGLIGLGAFAVPRIFVAGQAWLLPLGAMDSTKYLLISAIILGLSILPWCILMGTTFPSMMTFIREQDEAHTTSFSFLYLANVIGAMCGTLLTAAVLIEVLGLHHTLYVAASANFLIAVISALLGLRHPRAAATGVASTGTPVSAPTSAEAHRSPLIISILFATGFISMAMEVVWTRGFTPVLRTTIYSFASLLAVYLFATWVGSILYRRHLALRRVFGMGELIAFLAVVSFFPILLNDPRIHLPFIVRAGLVLFSIFPFSAALGYLTPKLIDEYAAGHPAAAGAAYAINIIGCILGPLVAGYVLLPWLGVTHALVILAVPFVVYFILLLGRMAARPLYTGATAIATAVLLLLSVFVVTGYEDRSYYGHGRLLRDHTATVLASGDDGRKQLYVNGISMTYMTPITKIMAHLPLCSMTRKPESALVICLGMGTTLRSLSTWDIDVTAVELVPSVRDEFDYFFSDAGEILKRPNCRVVIDDGRRFLRRTSQTYDLITIDPPPPVEAAGSSLLYSEQFYHLLKTRLSADGFLQQWYPGGEKLTLQAVARALVQEFPYVRMYHSIEGWGFHFTAATHPFEKPGVDEFISRLPEAAKKDLLEWSKGRDLTSYITDILTNEVPLDTVLNPAKEISVTDDRPYNEYFFLRRCWNKLTGRHESMH